MKNILILTFLLCLFTQNNLLAAEEIQFRVFPTSPPQGVTYYTVSTFDNSATIALWNENGKLFLYAEPTTTSFDAAGNRFTIFQNNQTYSGFQFYDSYGQLTITRIYEPTILECKLPYSGFDYSQPFEVCYDTAFPFENCFTFTPNQTNSLGYTCHYAKSVVTRTPVTFRVDIGENLYYKFYIRAGYGTAAYGQQPWQVIRNWSTLATATYNFNIAGHYILVVHIKENLSDTDFETIGFSIEVTE